MQAGASLTGVATGLVVVSAIAVTTFVLTGAGAPVTLAQTASKSSKIATADRRTVTMQYGGWQVTCDEAGDPPQTVCSAAYRIVDKRTNATILTWLLGRRGDGQLLTELFVPTEVLIEPGVSMTLDEGPVYQADFVACGRSACKAILPLDAALASELSNATQATLSLTASNGKVTRFSMGIEGVAAALAEMR
jgi:invasion protein IalB